MDNLLLSAGYGNTNSLTLIHVAVSRVCFHLIESLLEVCAHTVSTSYLALKSNSCFRARKLEANFLLAMTSNAIVQFKLVISLGFYTINGGGGGWVSASW